jgi:uncharacterized protein involved in response to NO
MPADRTVPLHPSLARIGISQAPAPEIAPRGLPLLRLGFRPFYLGAAVFAALAVPFWLVLFLGGASLPSGVPPLYWHAHEMLFGFAFAVVVGFLLTAGKAWTGLPTPRGTALGALAALWLAARLAAITGPYLLYALLDSALLPVIAAVFTTLLVRARNRRNLPLAAILGLLTAANVTFHLAVLGRLDVSPVRPLYAALALMVLIECVIAGRVIPFFTTNATPGLRIPERPRLNHTAVAVSGIALALWVFDAPGPAAAVAFLAAAALQLLRQWTWKPAVTRDRPILWILNASYAWIPIGFVLLACAGFGRLPASFGVHALAVGATAGLIIGMITRTARGHTGRALKVSRPEVLAYALVLGAAAVRVLLPIALPRAYVVALVIAAIAWSLAFAIYAFIYAPWLAGTRADGKDG